MSKLSERVRANCEAAPWVVKEIKKLEKQLEEADSCLDSILNFTNFKQKNNLNIKEIYNMVFNYFKKVNK